MRHLWCALGLLATASGAVQAQTLREQCAVVLAPEGCLRMADAAVSLPARAAIVAAGGNPVSGTASTLGMRLPGSPRVSVALRSTVAQARVPNSFTATPSEQRFTGYGVALDAGVGMFHGLNVAPTIGGFASLDVIASVGVVGVSGGDGFETGSAFSWGGGARLGILRESFTAPGVSVTALYRRVPDIEQPASDGTSQVHHVSAEDIAVMSLRGTVGKRVVGVGLTGGIGYDRVRSDVRISPRLTGPGGGTAFEFSDEVTDARLSYFGNVSYTTTILNFVGELGWQQSGEREAGMQRSTRRGGAFGGLAIRLAI